MWPRTRRTHPPRLLQCFSTSPLHLWALQLWPWGPWLNLALLSPLPPASCSTRRDVTISATGMDGLLRACSSGHLGLLLSSGNLRLNSGVFIFSFECFVPILRWFLRYCWKSYYNETWFAHFSGGNVKAETRFCAWPLQTVLGLIPGEKTKKSLKMAERLILRVFAKAEALAPSPSILVFPVLRKVGMKLSSSSLFSLPVYPGPSPSLTRPCWTWW